MSWMTQLNCTTLSERPRVIARNHQLYEIRRSVLKFRGIEADQLRSLITATLLLIVLETEPDEYSGLYIVIQSDDPRRAKLSGVRPSDRIAIVNKNTNDRAGIRVGRIKPHYIQKAIARARRYERYYPGPTPSPIASTIREIAPLRRKAATLFGDLTPSEIFLPGCVIP